MSDHSTLICRLASRSFRLKELSELSCGFGWYFYRFRCNFSYFCTNHKYKRDRVLRDRLGDDQFKGGNGSSQLRQFVYFQSCFENVYARRSRDTV